MTTAMRPKAIGYIRVSTNRQAENGYGLDAQRDQIQRYLRGNGLELVALIPDVMSGKRTDKLYGRIAAMTAIRTGIANVLVVNTLTAVPQHGGRREAGSDAKLEGWRIVGLDGTDSDTVSQLTAHAQTAGCRGRAGTDQQAHKTGADQSASGRKAVGQAEQIDRDTVARIIKQRNAGCGTKAIAKALTESKFPRRWAVRGATAPFGVFSSAKVVCN